MINHAKKTLNKKHLLIIGKTEVERRNFVNELIKVTDFETFRFPKGMSSIGEYYNFIKKEQLYTPWYEQKTYNSNQILDFHWDWIAENNSLVIMEEFHHMEERWRIGLLKEYVNAVENHKKGEKFNHLIISQESEDEIVEKLSEVILIKENERRTRMQIIAQKH